MPQVKRFYALPPVTEEGAEGGGTITRPKYTESGQISKVNSATVPAPDNQTVLDVLGVAAGDDVFLTMIQGEAEHLDELESTSGDIFRVVSDPSSSTTLAPTIPADDVAGYLNNEFRPQTFEELLEQLGDDYRYLSAGEWAERLGLASGFDQ